MTIKTIYQQAYRTVIQTLRERRESLGITQTALSVHLGWPQQTVSAIEAGARRLDLLEFAKVASALGMSSKDASTLLLATWTEVKVEPIAPGKPKRAPKRG